MVSNLKIEPDAKANSAIGHRPCRRKKRILSLLKRCWICAAHVLEVDEVRAEAEDIQIQWVRDLLRRAYTEPLAEFELAAGILLGVGASTLLSAKTGNEIRQEALETGKRVLERARQEIERRKKKTASNGAQSSEQPPQQQSPAEQTQS